MDRPLKFLIAAVAAAAAPLPAAAQAWPATVVAGAPQIAPQKRLPLTIGGETYLRRAWDAPRAGSYLASRPALKLTPTRALGDIPDVRVEAKDEWTDDQGLRVGPTKLAFKRRF